MVDSDQRVTFGCDICNTKSSTKRTAERHHKIVHSGEKPFQCDFCPQNFALKFILDNHRETHNPQFIKCEVCFSKVRCKYMKKHMKMVHELHKPAIKVTCNICGKSMKGKSLRQHSKMHKEKLLNPSRTEKCPICKKQYSFPEGKDLSMHMAKHELAKEYKCKDCQKYFATNSTLMTHTRLHTGEKP